MNGNNVIIDYNGIEIYQSDIDILCDQYIATLPDPENIYKSNTFLGLLYYIYRQYLKEIIIQDKKNAGMSDYNNHYDFLDYVFNNIYVPLCMRYNSTPTILAFCCFVDIDNCILGDIKNGVYRSTGQTVNPATSQTVKRWFKACESALYNRAIDTNSIGSIFALKANHGYQEAAQRLEVVPASAPASPEQIAEKYATAEKPKLLNNSSE